MPSVLIRNLDEELLSRLKSQAKTNGRSLQAEIHDALQRASAHTLAQTRTLSAAWLRRLKGSPQSDSTKLIREARNHR